MKRNLTLIRLLVSAMGIILISTVVSCKVVSCKKDEWCVGRWTGRLDNSKMHEEYVIRIRADHSCIIKAHWYWGNRRSSDFEADWEPISDDVIKIYDYDGHNEIMSFDGGQQRRIMRWSMYLRKDGAFSSSQSTLDRPEGYLTKSDNHN